jgi:hypothetical protein
MIFIFILILVLPSYSNRSERIVTCFDWL